MAQSGVDQADTGHFEYPDAFDHNRRYKVNPSGSRLSGCHDLRYLLHAQARGLVVAAVTKRPGEGLPEGVWSTRVACRKDVQDPPNSKLQQAVAPCPGPKDSIQFKNQDKLIIKTVYDPCLWSDKLLAECCLEAFREAGQSGMFQYGNNNYTWEGKFVRDGKEFWIHGYSRGQNTEKNLLSSKIRSFFFVHPDDLLLKE